MLTNPSSVLGTNLKDLDIAKVLSFGAIGLGFLLALFAYRLLAAEQGRANSRASMLKAVYVFMAFSIVLTLIGLAQVSMQAPPRPIPDTDTVASKTLPPARTESFFVAGKIGDVEGTGIANVNVKVTEIMLDGSLKELRSYTTGEAGDFAFSVPMPPDSKIKIETSQPGYRGQMIILQKNAVTIPATLARSK